MNYFLRGRDGRFLNEKTDKGVWLKWMELRVHGEAKALHTPTGLIPKYEDLRRIFKEVQGKDYPEEAYTKQFTVRVPELLAKIGRVTKHYQTKEPGAPQLLFEVLEEQRRRLIEAKEKLGGYIPPQKLSEE